MSLLQYVLKKDQLIRVLPKQICTCFYRSYERDTWLLEGKRSWPLHDKSGRRLLLWQQERFAGHSKWQNIKFKKMHKDNARAKIFGRLSLEMIQAVKESGPDVAFNPKLEGLILKAKSSSMPKDKIESSIKNALRHSDEKLSRVLLQARGPGKCGLMIDVLSPNITRAKGEIKQILKRRDALFIDDGSVAFMFLHKGVLTVEAISPTGEISEDEKAEAEEVAIMIGAEDIFFDVDERNTYQFICDPLEIYQLQKILTTDYNHLKLLGADTQYIAKSLLNLSEELMERADALIDLLSDHPDVVNVYDNIIDYPSKTIKVADHFG